jgi:hypothetical protein
MHSSRVSCGLSQLGFLVVVAALDGCVSYAVNHRIRRLLLNVSLKSLPS